MVQVLFHRLPHGRDLPLPAAATAGAAGLDMRAAVGASEPVTLKPGERAAIPTGLIMIVPEGHEAQIRPRSGLALRHGVTCLNTPGTIDSDYRGEVQVLLINLGQEPFVVERGMRVAQMVIAPVMMPQVAELDAPPDATTRGEGGFGSTGTQ